MHIAWQLHLMQEKLLPPCIHNEQHHNIQLYINMPYRLLPINKFHMHPMQQLMPDMYV